MEFTQGQVFGFTKISQRIKLTQTKKTAELKRQEELSLFNTAKEEIDVLKSTLDELYDKEAIEASIYRLKAAELDFNRQLREKKTSQIKA